MKQKTAMMLLIDKLIRMPDSHIKNYLILTQDDLIEKEKEQIIEAYDRGKYYSHNRNPREYYNETYKQD